MRLKFFYVGVLLVALGTLVARVMRNENPEISILGHWKEVSWDYEKDNRPSVTHRAESWRFSPGGKLVISDDKRRETVKWRLLGRSNILLLKYASGVTENYTITQFDTKRLILNFDSDIQARGGAKLIFERVGAQ